MYKAFIAMHCGLVMFSSPGLGTSFKLNVFLHIHLLESCFRPLVWGLLLNKLDAEKCIYTKGMTCFRPLVWGLLLNRYRLV